MKAIEYKASGIGGTYGKTGYLFENGIFISKFTFYNNNRYFCRKLEFNKPPEIVFWGKGVSSKADYDYQAYKLDKTLEMDFDLFISKDMGSYWPEPHHENAKPIDVLLKEIVLIKRPEISTPKKSPPMLSNLSIETRNNINFCMEKIVLAHKQKNTPIPAYLGQIIESLLLETLRKMNLIKLDLGASHTEYVEISNKLCEVTIELVDTYVNKSQGNFFHIPKEGIEFLKKIETLAMYDQTRERYNDVTGQIRKRSNAESQEIREKVNQYSNLNLSKKKEGCYIATAVYGNYDHVEVLKLRAFRDNTLNKSVLGRLFIKFYYKFSPMLVKYLSEKKQINEFIKKVLNFIIYKFKMK